MGTGRGSQDGSWSIRVMSIVSGRRLLAETDWRGVKRIEGCLRSFFTFLLFPMIFMLTQEKTHEMHLCMLQIAMLSLGFGEETTQREDERVDGLAKYNSWGTDVHALRGDARMQSYTIIKLNVIYWGTIVIPWFLVLHDAIPLTIVVSYLKAHVLQKTILGRKSCSLKPWQLIWFARHCGKGTWMWSWQSLIEWTKRRSGNANENAMTWAVKYHLLDTWPTCEGPEYIVDNNCCYNYRTLKTYNFQKWFIGWQVPEVER